MKTVFAATDVLLACGDQEGLGLSTLEAMAHGVPVVVRDDGGGREVVEHALTGHVVRSDRGVDLAAAVWPILHDRKLKARLGNAGLRRCRERFDPAASARLLMDVYDRVLNVRGRSGPRAENHSSQTVVL